MLQIKNEKNRTKSMRHIKDQITFLVIFFENLYFNNFGKVDFG